MKYCTTKLFSIEIAYCILSKSSNNGRIKRKSLQNNENIFLIGIVSTMEFVIYDFPSPISQLSLSVL